jgi:hypothetical protein
MHMKAVTMLERYLVYAENTNDEVIKTFDEWLNS